MSYTSDRKFKIWAYSTSHSFLLIRSYYAEDEQYKFNIDIEFVDVDYLDIPRLLKGISIEELKENLPEKFSKYQNSPRFRVFQIKSDANYYIVAHNYIVGKNSWIGEDRMINSSLKYDKILATSDKR